MMRKMKEERVRRHEGHEDEESLRKRIRVEDDDEFELNNLTGSNLTEAIWEERKFELAMEGHRFFDLLRTNQASSVIPGFIQGKHEVFPIPQQEIDISGLTQNPGY